jgi:hypothetical protein
MQYAFPKQSQGQFGAPILASAFSTVDIAGILSNIANKFVREAFNSVESAWRQITAIRNVSDFKTITSHSLTGDLQYEKIGAGGEICPRARQERCVRQAMCRPGV